MHVGVDSFVSAVTDPETEHVVGPEERIEHLLEEIAMADSSGLYSFGIGEHHRCCSPQRPRGRHASGWGAR
jgi:hypothetical protein